MVKTRQTEEVTSPVEVRVAHPAQPSSHRTPAPAPQAPPVNVQLSREVDKCEADHVRDMSTTPIAAGKALHEEMVVELHKCNDRLAALHLAPSQAELESRLTLCNAHKLRSKAVVSEKDKHSWHTMRITELLNVCQAKLAKESSPPVSSDWAHGYVKSFHDTFKRHCVGGSEVEKKTVLRVELKGRTGNNMLQYMFARATADLSGFGILPYSVDRGDQHAMDFLDGFPNVWYEKEGSGKKQVGKNVYACNDAFQQNYLFYQHMRPLAMCLFTPSVMQLSSAALSIGMNDVVVHVRDEFFMLADMSPPYAYYKASLGHLKATGSLGTVWIVTSLDLRKHEIVAKLQSEYGAKLHSGTVDQDHLFGRVAPNLIGGFGTYSWTMAYLSQGRRMFLPFWGSQESGANWLPWSALFIHDDPRVLYINCEDTGGKPLTAEEVMGGSTRFAKGVKSRGLPTCGPRKIVV